MGNANLTVEASTYELAHRGVPRTAVTDRLADTYLQAQEDRGADRARAAEPTGASTGASLAQTADKPLG
jgi:hypothetical protein